MFPNLHFWKFSNLVHSHTLHTFHFVHLTFQVEEIDLPFDRLKGQRKAFCFITFEGEDQVEKACCEQKHLIDGKHVSIKQL